MRLLVPAASAALIAALAQSAPPPVPVSTSFRASTSFPVSTSVPVSPSAPVSTSVSDIRAAAADYAAPLATRLAPSQGFTWPLSPRPEVLRRFEQPRTQFSPGHRGVDLSASVGQSVLSAGDGVVAFSGVIAGRGVITMRHSGGLRTTYEPVDKRLASGARVRRGEQIAVVAATAGHCVPRTCLHWGAISAQTSSGQTSSAQSYRDPLSLLGFGRPILLPLG